MDILVRKKPFRDENQGGFVNDVDSEDEDHNTANRLRSEFLGGGGASDCEEIEDTEGDLTIHRQAIKKCTLHECKAMLARTNEVERANAPGRTKEADAQMKTYALAFDSVLQKKMPSVSRQNAPARPSLPIHDAANFQRCIAKDLRAQQNNKKDQDEDNVDLDAFLELCARNEARDNEHCVTLPLDDILRGPGHVAWKLIQNLKDDAGNNFEFNDEQINCIALQIWPLEQAWRLHLQGKQNACATVNTLRRKDRRAHMQLRGKDQPNWLVWTIK